MFLMTTNRGVLSARSMTHGRNYDIKSPNKNTIKILSGLQRTTPHPVPVEPRPTGAQALEACQREKQLSRKEGCWVGESHGQESSSFLTCRALDSLKDVGVLEQVVCSWASWEEVDLYITQKIKTVARLFGCTGSLEILGHVGPVLVETSTTSGCGSEPGRASLFLAGAQGCWPAASPPLGLPLQPRPAPAPRPPHRLPGKHSERALRLVSTVAARKGAKLGRQGGQRA